MRLCGVPTGRRTSSIRRQARQAGAPCAGVQPGAPREQHDVEELAVQVGQAAALREALQHVRRDVRQADAAERLREVAVPDVLPARSRGWGGRRKWPRDVHRLAEVVVPRDRELRQHLAEAEVALRVAGADLQSTRDVCMRPIGVTWMCRAPGSVTEFFFG